MKKLTFIALTSLVIVSCSKQDEPEPEIYYQVAEITNGSTQSQKMVYDEYGRVIEYVESYQEDIVKVTYSYPSDDLIIVHTEDRRPHPFGGEDIVREYDDEISLEKGRITCCEGVFSSNETGASPFQKKYRQEFAYTGDNHINVVKWTEWNKRGDDWAYDKPWTWENYYIWENGNLVEVEDYLGNSKPVYIYKYSYHSTAGVQNLVRVPFGRYQYYPLQLKGYFGSMSKNLISTFEMEQDGHMPYVKEYTCEIVENRITRFTESRNGVSEVYDVAWTSGQ